MLGTVCVSNPMPGGYCDGDRKAHMNGGDQAVYPRWFSALGRPTEIPSSLLALHGPSRRTLCMPHHKAPPPPKHHQIVIPSVQLCNGAASALQSLTAHGRQTRRTCSQRHIKTLSRSYSIPHSRPSSGAVITGAAYLRQEAAAPEARRIASLPAVHTTNLVEMFGRGCVRLTVMGPVRGGKTALINRFVEGTFVDEYCPTSEVTHRKTVRLDSDEYIFELIDTSGLIRDGDEYYSEISHGFILVFNIIEPESFEQVRVIREHITSARGTQHVPMVVVATHGDTERPRLQQKIQEYHARVQEWGCDYFCLVSALSPRCVNVFYLLARLVREYYSPMLAKGGGSGVDCADMSVGNILTPRSMSVKSAPASLGRRFSKMELADELTRRQSSSSGSPTRSKNEHVPSLRAGLRMIGRKLSANSVQFAKAD